MRGAVHSRFPRLQVSPLALPPLACLNAVVSVDHWQVGGTEKRPLAIYRYDTHTRADADSTLAADLSGPKSGVHLTVLVSKLRLKGVQRTACKV